MKRLRRKKSSDNISSSKHSRTSSKDAGFKGNSTNDSTPLYARFATPRKDASSTVKPLVSGPIMLTPKSSSNISYNLSAEQTVSSPRKQLRRIPSSSISPNYDYTSTSKIPRHGSRTHVGNSARAENDISVTRSPRVQAPQLQENDAIVRPPTLPRDEDTYTASPIISTMMLQAIITTPEAEHIPLPHVHSQHARHDVLPTPPPSTSGSSVQAPAPISQQKVPSSDRRDKLASTSTSQSVKTALTPTQNAPIKRRKYSLLAAFGPQPSSKPSIEQNISKSDSIGYHDQVRELFSRREALFPDCRARRLLEFCFVEVSTGELWIIYAVSGVMFDGLSDELLNIKAAITLPCEEGFILKTAQILPA